MAFKEYKNSTSFIKVNQNDGQKIFSDILGASKKGEFDELIAQTPKNKIFKENPPNVVFALMESFGTHFLLSLDNTQRDLLGELREHFRDDYLFLRFVSEGDGTSDTLHRFFIRSPLNNISQSSIKNKFFPTNMFEPYKKAGYKIVFITSGNGNWRNLQSFCENLGVDEFYDENFLKSYYPQSSELSATWGVPDEFAFEFAKQKLNQSKEPVFIFLLSITNHPPYQTPKTYQKTTFDLSSLEKSRFKNLEKGGDINEILNTYRYANDTLGKFITQIKKDNKTIIAATGDHNMRGIGYSDETQIALGHGVPFYLYIPQIYRKNIVYDKNTVGSHKDIMPTLYENSLFEQNYIRTGCNLLAKQTHNNPFCGYGYNTEVIITKNGVFNLYKKTYHKWENIDKLISQSQISDIDEAELIKRASQYTPFLDYIINKMATQ